MSDIKTTGVIEEALRNAWFRVKLDNSEIRILAYIGGKMRKNNIKLLAGDKVSIEMSAYDLSKGRIVYRN